MNFKEIIQELYNSEECKKNNLVIDFNNIDQRNKLRFILTERYNCDFHTADEWINTAIAKYDEFKLVEEDFRKINLQEDEYTGAGTRTGSGTKSDPYVYDYGKGGSGSKGKKDKKTTSKKGKEQEPSSSDETGETSDIEQKEFKDPIDRSKFEKRSSKPKKSKSNDYPTLKEIHDSLGERGDSPPEPGNINLDVLTQSQNELFKDRAKGNGGAGGAVASEGESKYTKVSGDEFDNEKFKTENKQKIKEKKDELKERRKKGKYPNAEEQEILEALGLDPDSEEAYEYMSTRAVFAQKELDDIKKDPDSVYYKTGKNGFGGPKPPRPEPPKREDFESDEEFAKAQEKWDKNGEKKQKAWDEKEAEASAAYKDWMKAAYDGGIETKRILEANEEFDTTRPHKCIQSDPAVDDSVEAHLETEVKKKEELLMSCHKANDKKDWKEKCAIQQRDYDHYKNEHKLFKENREYHDTYVVGHDKDGNMYIVSISNKKDGNMRDPQNNMTPKGRFFLIKKILGGEVAENVSGALDDGIRLVTNVQQTSRDTSATTVNEKGELDGKDPIIERTGDIKVLSNKRRDDINERGTKRERLDGGKGKPSKGSEFGCWLEDKGISEKEWKKLNSPPLSAKDRKKLLELMAQFNGDADWHSKNKAPVKMVDDVTGEPVDEKGRTKEQYDALTDEEKKKEYPKSDGWEQGEKTWAPPYDPYTKTFIKVGEAVKHDELTEWKRKRKADGKDPDTDIYNKERLAELEDKVKKDEKLSNEEKCLLMKLREQESVNQAHANVINTIYDNDKPDGYHPKKRPDADNGKHARGYIRSVMDSLHFTKYIKMEGKDAEKMLIQMGINGAKPTDIRDCLAELSGFDGKIPPDDPEKLIEHLEKRCRLNQSTTPPSIEIVNEKGTKSLMEDTWRTAGTSQKVAAGFGGSMRECIKGKAKARRPKSKGKK